MSKSQSSRPVVWVASSKRDLLEMPPEIKSDFGYGLYEVQLGDHPTTGKTLSGFGGANVVELKADHQSGTFREVYTVRFAEVIFVLHAFQKKSKKGIETSKQDIELIKSRLKIAEDLYEKEWKKGKKK